MVIYLTILFFYLYETYQINLYETYQINLYETY